MICYLQILLAFDELFHQKLTRFLLMDGHTTPNRVTFTCVLHAKYMRFIDRAAKLLQIVLLFTCVSCAIRIRSICQKDIPLQINVLLRWTSLQIVLFFQVFRTQIRAGRGIFLRARFSSAAKNCPAIFSPRHFDGVLPHTLIIRTHVRLIHFIHSIAYSPESSG